MTTPTPLRIEGRDILRGNRLVARTFGDTLREQNEAATLFVAAEDLLAALKAVIETHCRNDKLFCGACTDARAIIAKAEGRNP